MEIQKAPNDTAALSFVVNSEAARYVFVVVVVHDGMIAGRRYGTFVLAWEHDGGLGSYFFSVGRGQAPPPFCVAITTALFAESRFFHACFFRVMLWVRGRPAACAV